MATTTKRAIKPVPAIEHDVADGCPDESAEHWKAIAHAASAEMVRERDIWHRDRRTRDEYERDFKAYALSAARSEVLRLLDYYLRREVASELNNLAYQLDNLPTDRLKASDLFFVRHAAADLKKRISEWHPNQVPELAELRRIHDAAKMAGERLHLALGPDLDYLGYCRCAGCELSRDLENAPAVPGAKYRLLRRRVLPSEQREETWSLMPDRVFDTPADAHAALRQLHADEPNFAHRYELRTVAA